jgi:ribosome-binding factor A
MKPLRSKRLGVEIRREISRIIEFEFRATIPAMTTITEVRLTPDLRIARVYYSVLGSADDKKRVGAFLTNATGRMRSLLAARITMRYHPSLEFRLDETLENAQRIEELIEKIHQEQTNQSSDEAGDS